MRAAFGPFYGGGRLLAATKTDPYIAGYMLHRIMSFAGWAANQNDLSVQDINPITDHASALLFKSDLQAVAEAMGLLKTGESSKDRFAKGAADAIQFNEYFSGSKDIREHPLFDRIVKHANQVALGRTEPRDFFTEYLMALQHLTFGRYWMDNYPPASLSEILAGWQ